MTAERHSLSKDERIVTVHIPVTFRQRAGRKQILTPSGSVPWSPTPRVDASLLKAIVRAHRWREMLESGEYSSAAELAKAEKVNDSYLSRILRLTLLAPEIVEAIVAGHQPSTLQVDDLLKPLPLDWRQQRSILQGRQ
jgi:ParB-like chromosome segregation protein Spo0J